MNAGLRFTYLYHDTDILEVRIEAGNGRFHASAKVYESVGHLIDAAAILKGFPVDSRDTRQVVFGSFGSESAGGAAKFEFFCKDMAGHSMIRATIEGDDGNFIPSYSEQHGSPESAILYIDFEPASLDAFLTDLEQLDRNQSGCAEMPAVLF